MSFIQNIRSNNRGNHLGSGRKISSREVDMELDRLIEVGLRVYLWFLGQPLPLQIILGIGLLSAGYFLLVMLRMVVTALLVTFRGL